MKRLVNRSSHDRATRLDRLGVVAQLPHDLELVQRSEVRDLRHAALGQLPFQGLDVGPDHVRIDLEQVQVMRAPRAAVIHRRALHAAHLGQPPR